MDGPSPVCVGQDSEFYLCCTCRRTCGVHLSKDFEGMGRPRGRTTDGLETVVRPFQNTKVSGGNFAFIQVGHHRYLRNQTSTNNPFHYLHFKITTSLPSCFYT